MGEIEDLKAKAVELAASMLGQITGRAKELYESNAEVKDIMERTLRSAAKLALELATEGDEQRRESIMTSLDGARDTGRNAVAAVFQGALNEAAEQAMDWLSTVVGFLKEAAPVLVSFALKSLRG
jgi:formiminotetrahydrofolate cyclodeaminase